MHDKSSLADWVNDEAMTTRKRFGKNDRAIYGKPNREEET
jgi:hypothetical protein